MNEKQVGIQSVETAMEILYAFKSSNTPVSLTALSQMTGVPKGNLHKYLVSLIRKDMVKQDKESALYSLGHGVLELGLWELNRLDSDAVFDTHMQMLSAELDQSVALALWQNNSPIIVRYKKSTRPINIEMQLGYRPSPVISATGKCFMAFLPKNEQKKALELSGDEFDPEVFFSELETIQRDKVSFRLDEYDNIPGSKAIASPIYNYTGSVAAVISLIGFSRDFELTTESPYVEALIRHAQEISCELLHSESK